MSETQEVTKQYVMHCNVCGYTKFIEQETIPEKGTKAFPGWKRTLIAEHATTTPGQMHKGEVVVAHEFEPSEKDTLFAKLAELAKKHAEKTAE